MEAPKHYGTLKDLNKESLYEGNYMFICYDTLLEELYSGSNRKSKIKI